MEELTRAIGGLVTFSHEARKFLKLKAQKNRVLICTLPFVHGI
jgi:hypothetical protein